MQSNVRTVSRGAATAHKLIPGAPLPRLRPLCCTLCWLMTVIADSHQVCVALQGVRVLDHSGQMAVVKNFTLKTAGRVHTESVEFTAARKAAQLHQGAARQRHDLDARSL